MTTIDTTLPTLAELRARKAASGGLPTLAELRARKAAGTLAPAGPDTTAPPAGPTLDDRLNALAQRAAVRGPVQRQFYGAEDVPADQRAEVQKFRAGIDPLNVEPGILNQPQEIIPTTPTGGNQQAIIAQMEQERFREGTPMSAPERFAQGLVNAPLQTARSAVGLVTDPLASAVAPRQVLDAKDRSDAAYEAQYGPRGFAGRLGAGVGQVAVAAPLAAAGGLGAGAGVLAASSAEQGYQDYLQNVGRDRASIAKALSVGGLYGAAEYVAERIGLGAILRETGTRGGLEAVKGALRAAGVNASEEALTQVAQNAISKYSYDPGRSLTEGAGEAGLIGGVAGGVAHGAMHAGGEHQATWADMEQLKATTPAPIGRGDTTAQVPDGAGPPAGVKESFDANTRPPPEERPVQNGERQPGAAGDRRGGVDEPANAGPLDARVPPVVGDQGAPAGAESRNVDGAPAVDLYPRARQILDEIGVPDSGEVADRLGITLPEADRLVGRWEAEGRTPAPATGDTPEGTAAQDAGSSDVAGRSPESSRDVPSQKERPSPNSTRPALGSSRLGIPLDVVSEATRQREAARENIARQSRPFAPPGRAAETERRSVMNRVRNPDTTGYSTEGSLTPEGVIPEGVVTQPETAGESRPVSDTARAGPPSAETSASAARSTAGGEASAETRAGTARPKTSSGELSASASVSDASRSSGEGTREAKQPWEMTKQEFRKAAPWFHGTAREAASAIEREGFKPATGYLSGDRPQRLVGPGEGESVWLGGKRLAARYAVTPPDWAPTTHGPHKGANRKGGIVPVAIRADAVEGTDYRIAREHGQPVVEVLRREAVETHRQSVERALSEGRPVPAEVLADYPELGGAERDLTDAEMAANTERNRAEAERRRETARVESAATRERSQKNDATVRWDEAKAARNRKVPIAGPKADEYVVPRGGTKNVVARPIEHQRNLDRWELYDPKQRRVIETGLGRNEAWDKADAANKPTPSTLSSVADTVPKNEAKPAPEAPAAEGGERRDGVASSAEGVGKYGVYAVNIKDRGVRYAVRESDNPRGYGDSIHETIDAAHKYAEQVKERDQKNAEYRQAEASREATKKATDDARKADEQNLDGFADDATPLRRGQVAKTLNSLVNIGGKTASMKEHIREMVKGGAPELTTREEPRIAPMSRTQFNRADGRQQAAHEKKMKDAGTKTVYRVNGYDLGKTGYDYAKHLVEKQTQEAAPSKLSKLASYAAEKAAAIKAAPDIRQAGKGFKGKGGRAGASDLGRVASYAAWKAVELGAKAGERIRVTVEQAIEHLKRFGVDTTEANAKRVAKMANAWIGSAEKPDGTIDPGRLESAREAGMRRTRIAAAIGETKIRLSEQGKAARVAFNKGLAEGRRTAIDKLSNAADAEGTSRKAVLDIVKALPVGSRGRIEYVSLIARAKTLNDVREAARMVAFDLHREVVKQQLTKTERLAKYKNLTPELKADLATVNKDVAASLKGMAPQWTIREALAGKKKGDMIAARVPMKLSDAETTAGQVQLAVGAIAQKIATHRLDLKIAAEDQKRTADYLAQNVAGRVSAQTPDTWTPIWGRDRTARAKFLGAWSRLGYTVQQLGKLLDNTQGKPEQGYAETLLFRRPLEGEGRVAGEMQRTMDTLDELARKHGYKSFLEAEDEAANNYIDDTPLGRITWEEALTIAGLDPETKALFEQGAKVVPHGDVNKAPDQLDQERQKRITDKLPERAVKLYRDAKRAIYEEQYRDRALREIEVLTGTRPPTVEDYQPRRSLQQHNFESGVVNGSPDGIITVEHMLDAQRLERASFGKERIAGPNATFVVEPAYVVMKRQAARAAKIIHLARAVRDARSVFARQEVQQAIQKTFGRGAWRAVQRQIKQMSMLNPMSHDVGFSRTMKAATRNVGRALTQLNPASFLRQYGTVFNAMHDFGWARGVAALRFGASGKLRAEMIASHPLLRQRYETGQGFQTAQAVGGAGRPTKAGSLDTEGLRVALKGINRDIRRGDLAGAWRNISSGFDAIKLNNIADAQVATVVYGMAKEDARAAHPEASEERIRELAGEATALWVHRRANTSSSNSSGLWVNNVRDNPSFSPLALFTSDRTKIFNMIVDAKHEGKAKTASAVAASGLNALWSQSVGRVYRNVALYALASALWGSEAEEEKKNLWGRNFIASVATDMLGSLPGGDAIGKAADAALSAKKGELDSLLSNPVTDTADAMYGIVVKALSAMTKPAVELERDKAGGVTVESLLKAEKSAQSWSGLFTKAFDASATLAGLPFAVPRRDLSKLLPEKSIGGAFDKAAAQYGRGEMTYATETVARTYKAMLDGGVRPKAARDALVSRLSYRLGKEAKDKPAQKRAEVEAKKLVNAGITKANE